MSCLCVTPPPRLSLPVFFCSRSSYPALALSLTITQTPPERNCSAHYQQTTNIPTFDPKLFVSYSGVSLSFFLSVFHSCNIINLARIHVFGFSRRVQPSLVRLSIGIIRDFGGSPVDSRVVLFDRAIRRLVAFCGIFLCSAQRSRKSLFKSLDSSNDTRIVLYTISLSSKRIFRSFLGSCSICFLVYAWFFSRSMSGKQVFNIHPAHASGQIIRDNIACFFRLLVFIRDGLACSAQRFYHPRFSPFILTMCGLVPSL